MWKISSEDKKSAWLKCISLKMFNKEKSKLYIDRWYVNMLIFIRHFFDDRHLVCMRGQNKKCAIAKPNEQLRRKSTFRLSSPNISGYTFAHIKWFIEDVWIKIDLKLVRNWYELIGEWWKMIKEAVGAKYELHTWLMCARFLCECHTLSSTKWVHGAVYTQLIDDRPITIHLNNTY